MSDPAVVLDRVSKRFWLSSLRGASLKERVLRGPARAGHEALWALSEVSLRIARGSTVGVIGPNGCGKSTLLQIVAGVLEPDSGTVGVHGRVTSLLELGAGFSPELTGRENVYLNASLHGVPREIVHGRFDAIVAFAELERFIDMPVRTYSSGMYMRLGFAVAVHLDPEIVLVDEAFAVGDAHFQRKCLHTIREIQRAGRTIVLVSHDLQLVERLCTEAVLLQQGRLVAAGAPSAVIGQYHALDMGRESPGASPRWGTGAVQITAVDLLRGGEPTDVLRTRDTLTIRLHYRCEAPVERPVFGVAIHTDDGVHVTGPNTRTSGFPLDRLEGSGALDYAIERLPLLPGRYLVSAAVYDQDLVTAYDHRDRLLPFVVVEGGTDERLGVVELGAGWRRAEAGAAGDGS